MLPARQRAVVGGPAFIRLLARLTGTDVPPPDPSLSDRLSQWLNWKHALALSTALDGAPLAESAEMSTVKSDLPDECARIRAIQVEAIVVEAVGGGQNGVRKVAVKEGVGNEASDFSVFRQRYLTRQRSMQSATGDLRGRLRDALAATSVAMGRLAEVDAAMELALSPREQTLLAHVPLALESRFETLRQAALVDGTTTPDTWLEVFRKDMQSVLLAELDVRFQPVDALLAALRAC